MTNARRKTTTNSKCEKLNKNFTIIHNIQHTANQLQSSIVLCHTLNYKCDKKVISELNFY